MKIKDIITEQSGGFQSGRQFISKLSSPSQWGLGGNTDYEAGKSFISKLASPSQWFQGGKNFQQGRSAVDKIKSPNKWFQGGGEKSRGSYDTVSTSPDYIDLGTKKPFEVRRNLDNLASGQYYNQDVAVAKMFHDQLKAGSFKPAVDIESTIGSLKKVIDRTSLSKDDLERIKKLKTATKNLS
jgi:hypothetical protein